MVEIKGSRESFIESIRGLGLPYALQLAGLLPEQVQIFTPSPSTYATLMYYTETDPFSGQKIFVEKDAGNKRKQKTILMRKNKVT